MCWCVRVCTDMRACVWKREVCGSPVVLWHLTRDNNNTTKPHHHIVNKQPSARSRGLGSRIVKHLVSDFQASQPSPTAGRLLLLTLGSTAPFYERHGFRVLDDPKAPEAGLPPLLLFEYLAGSVVARISRGAGTKLVVMELQR